MTACWISSSGACRPVSKNSMRTGSTPCWRASPATSSGSGCRRRVRSACAWAGGLCGVLVVGWMLGGRPVTARAADGGSAEAGETGAAQPSAEVDIGMIPPEVVRVAREVRTRPLGERMAAVSEPLLGRPYQVDATGEGVEPDLDPPARYDVFDCLTFVEEVLALSLAADPTSAPMVRNRLRYGASPPRYDNRRHFMVTQWIPGAIADGWLEDITDTLGPAHLLQLDIDDRTWRGWRRRSLFQLPDERLPTGHFELPVLSVDAAMEAAADIPPGALIVTVRHPKEGVPMVVTHVGFKIPSPADRPLVRHATRMRGQRVMDHSLLWYLDHLRWYHRWPVEGISVLMPREAGPRRSRLDAARSTGALPRATAARSGGTSSGR
ncbi:MAG: DUF1460 domain-containing protein [Deltaproteobacteria bacterium]|nr:MAG: DUF1460 domain-containing protein [Deltaproteobacteria bacterium]